MSEISHVALLYGTQAGGAKRGEMAQDPSNLGAVELVSDCV
jgi:hypothetical protein